MITHTAKNFSSSKSATSEHSNRKHVRLQYPARLGLISMETFTSIPDQKILSCVC